MRRIAHRNLTKSGPQLFEEPPFGRRETLTRALCELHRLQREPVTIVETGTLRNDSESGMRGDGWSTMAWGWYCREVGGRVYTVDVKQENLAVCRRVTERYADVIEYVESDSVAFLRQWDVETRGPIHLLYLDSLDYLDHQREQSEEHHRAEAEAALPSLADPCLVLIDDTSPAGDPDERGVPPLTGKGARAVPFLLERGFRLEWCIEHQVLLSRGATHVDETAVGDALSADFQQALDWLTKAIAPPRTLCQPLNLLAALRACDALYDASENGPPAAVAEYLISQHGWDREDAERIGFVWEVVAGLRDLHRVRRHRADAPFGDLYGSRRRSTH
jgi:hypothetical protein